MPYILAEARPRLTRDLPCPETAGELNFVITSLVDEYVAEKGLSYAILNEVVGVLECAKAEFYRRVVAPYEDTKIQANGDVYTQLPEDS